MAPPDQGIYSTESYSTVYVTLPIKMNFYSTSLYQTNYTIPTDAVEILLRTKREDIYDYYNYYIGEGVGVEEYERSHDQNKELGLNGIWDENYQDNDGNFHPTKVQGGEEGG